MIPYLLAAVGGYLIGDSIKSQSFAKGGEMKSIKNGDKFEVTLDTNLGYKSETYDAIVEVVDDEINSRNQVTVKHLSGKMKGAKTDMDVKSLINKKMADGGVTNNGLWESVKEKFSQVYFEEDFNDDEEIYSNQVKAEEHKWMFDKYSPYASPLSWEDAKYKFLSMLTPEEKSIISIEENVKDVHELFGVMSEKKILLKRIKKMAKGGNVDDDLENFDVSELDAYESMQYNHFIEKSKLSKKEALKVLINSVDEDYSQLNPKLRKIAKKYKFGGEINKGDKFYYTESGKKEFSIVEDVKDDNVDIFINKPESHNKGKVYSKDKHITVPKKTFRHYAIPIRTKFEFADGGDVSVASTILQQLGGQRRLNAMTGAYNFYDVGNGVSFKIKNPRANYIKIKLNGKDLYDVEVGRIRGTTYKVIMEQNDVYFDQLKGLLEKATGMYFSL